MTKWIATTAYALEGVTARELRELGMVGVETQVSRVLFDGTLEDAARANVFLRSAGKVRMVAGEFEARTFDELFDGVRALPWEQWVLRGMAFPVTARSVSSELASLSHIQSITKKAIAERLKGQYGAQWLQEDGAQVPVEVHLYKNKATVSLDTSGDGLHMRGYRKLNGEASLRETLAASLVLMTKWQGDRAFADPLCGTGTIAIEAVMFARKMAPGLRRSFAAERWPWFGPEPFQLAKRQALDEVRRDIKLDITASDIDPKALSMAEYHARSAGVIGDLRILRADARSFAPSAEAGHIICNPPYGKRLGDVQKAEALYEELGRAFRLHHGWSVHVITACERFESLYGAKADKKREVRNGPLACRYFEFFAGSRRNG